MDIAVRHGDRRWVWDVDIAVGHGGRGMWRLALGVGCGDRRRDRFMGLFIYGASCSFMGLILLGFCWSFVGFVLAVVG